MGSQQEEHLEIIRDGLEDILHWARGTGQTEEAASIKKVLALPLGNFEPRDWRLVAEIFRHAGEWFENVANHEPEALYAYTLSDIAEAYSD